MKTIQKPGPGQGMKALRCRPAIRPGFPWGDQNGRHPRRVLLLALVVMGMLGAATSQSELAPCCEQPLVDIQVKVAGHSKVGYAEFIASTPPKFYLKMVEDQKGEYKNGRSEGRAWAISHAWIGYNSYSLEGVGTYSASGHRKDTFVMDKYGNETYAYEGNASGTSTFDGHSWIEVDSVVQFDGAVNDHGSGSMTFTTNSMGGGPEWLGHYDDGVPWPFMMSFPEMRSEGTTTHTSYSYTLNVTLVDQPDLGIGWEWILNGEQNDTITIDLSKEFDTGMLRSWVLADLGGPDENWGYADDYAFFEMPVDETELTIQKMRFRYYIPSTVKDKGYTVTWKEYTTIAGPAPLKPSTTWVTRKEKIIGTGDYYLSDWIHMDAPEVSDPYTYSEVFVNEFCVLADDSPCATSCTDPRSAKSAGTGQADVHSVDFQLSLGFTTNGNQVGFLSINKERLTVATATPADLELVTLPDAVQVTTAGGGQLRQVKAAQTLADIVTANDFKYYVRFYNITNSVPQTNSDPFVTWTIENPDASTNTFNRLRITETRGVQNIQTDYVWAEATKTWQLITGNGLRKETKAGVWNENQTVFTETQEIRGSADQLVYKAVRTSTLYSFGLRLTGEVVDPDGAALTSTYTYNDQGRREQVVNADGSWTYTQYDDLGRPTTVYSTFGNQGPTTDPTLCRSSEYSYAGISGSGDPGTNNIGTSRRTIEKLLGQEVSRTYTVLLPYEQRTIRCQTAGAAWDATDNLVTVIKKYSAGDFIQEVKSIQSYDGTIQLFEYATNSSGGRSTTVYSGLPNSATNAITVGSITTTVRDLLGQVLTNTAVDFVSGITISREVYSEFDVLNRPQRLTHLNGSYDLTIYNCCFVESFIDREGTTTVYGYDDLKRQTVLTRNNISTIMAYNAAGQILSTTRQGTNGTTMMLGRTSYDLAGRMLLNTNAMTNITSYAHSTNSSGQRIITTTLPDTGTRIETSNEDGSLAKVTGTGVHPVRSIYDIETEGGVLRPYRKEIKLDAGGSDTSEWVKSYSDLLGRDSKTVYPDGAASLTEYNDLGQAWKQVDPDGNITLRTNINLNEQYTFVDLNQNSEFDWTTDRITGTVTDYYSNTVVVADVRRTRSYAYATPSSSTPTLISTTESSTDGMRTWQMFVNGASVITNRTGTGINPSTGYRYVTNTSPDGAQVISVSQYGQLLSVTRKDSGGSQISQTTFDYDQYGRRWQSTDARNGASTTSFNNADQVVTTTTPAPATGQSAQSTTTAYDSMGRGLKVALPDGGAVTNEFYLTGELKRTYGTRSYAVGYGYDDQGRMTRMTNWSSFTPISQSGVRVTTWNYESQRGFLGAKVYADTNTVAYTNTLAGKLAQRTWARGTTASYTYNAAGDLATVTYSDSTPGVTNDYDRRGRRATVLHNGITTAYAYSDAGQVLSESYSGGSLNGLSVTNGYDTLLRRTTLALQNGGTALSTTTYGYDDASRLHSVTGGTESAVYSYLANSPLVEQIVFKQSGTTRMTTTKAYDYLNRLTNTSSGTGLSFGYGYNDGNQRIRVNNADSTYWVYQYDALGQVTSGKKYWSSDDTLVAGQQYEYGFDDIGNRKTAKEGGDAAGLNLRTNTYGANTLNQYTNRTVAAAMDLRGEANSSSVVTVNNQTVYRRGTYFWKEFGVTNASGPVYVALTNLAVRPGAGSGGEDVVSTVTGNAFVAQTPEAYTYDYDGNQTGDGRWDYTWDGENRLIQMEAKSGIPAAAKQKLVFAYDHQGRRISKTVSNYVSSAYTLASQTKFLYDGWNLIAELDPSNAAQSSYMWGLDLSGSLQGAGGVGGLLAVKNHTSVTNHFVCYDANGNVATLLSANDGTVTAQYQYGPFGELIRATGPMAKVNPFRFSTKYQDDETDLLFYGKRYLRTSTGSWLSRDPMGERGGLNVYCFARNDGIIFFDPDGRITVTTLTKNPTSDCGSAEVKWTFALDQPAPGDGYIVQKVTRSYDYQSCDGKTKVKTTQTFWEAWLVKKGQVNETGAALYGFTDNAGEPPRPQTHGTLTKAGEIKFFLASQTGNMGDPGVNPPVPPDPTTGFGGSNGNPSSGGLPSSNNPPSWWNNPSDNGEKTGTRSVTTTWNCCACVAGFIGPLQESSTISVVP